MRYSKLCLIQRDLQQALYSLIRQKVADDLYFNKINMLMQKVYVLNPITPGLFLLCNPGGEAESARQTFYSFFAALKLLKNLITHK